MMIENPNPEHKAGFVSIIGRPNVGKSTLMNQLVGEKLSIITSKAQTTRHRILGIINGEDYQIVYSDTPGIIKPSYALQASMLGFVKSALSDADVILFITDPFDQYQEDNEVLQKLHKTDTPVLLVFNKIDLMDEEEDELQEKLDYWKKKINVDEYLVVSALHNINVHTVFDHILKHLPKHPPYYPKDTLTDKPERFFASEIIREKIFSTYKKEVPYSTEVVISEFKEEEDIIRIRAEIFVERTSQKGILIGHKGANLKKVGTEARLDMEEFFQKKVFLETYVKVEKDWRKKADKLKRFGYRG